MKKLSYNQEEVSTRYRNLYTALVNDTLREMNLLNQALPTSILPLREEMMVAGPAFTIISGKEATSDFSVIDIPKRMEYRAKILDAIYEGAVVVWDTNGDNASAQWGAMMTMMAKKKGCTGAVVDGGLRDTKQVLEQDFPVFYRYRTSNGVLGRHRWLGYESPVRIGNVILTPGDYVFGDIDGVVIVPRALTIAVLEKAEQKAQHEALTREWIAQDKNAYEVVKRGGMF